MALITCPECNKEISDKAYSCPFCGFPLQDYFKEEEEKKQIQKAQERELEIKREKEEKLRQLKEKIQTQRDLFFEEQKFSVFGKQMSFDENKRRCALVGAEIETCETASVVYLQTNFISRGGFTNYTYDDFEDYLNQLFQFIGKNLADCGCNMCNLFLYEESPERENLRYDMEMGAAQLKELGESVAEISSTFGGAKETLERKSREAYQKYEKVLDKAQYERDVVLIDSVYSRTLSGLLVSSVTAKLINKVASESTKAFKKSRNSDKIDQFYEIIINERSRADAKVWTVIEKSIVKMMHAYRIFLLDYLMKAGALYKTYTYPVKDVDTIELLKICANAETKNNNKKDMIRQSISQDPGNISIYKTALKYIAFTEGELIDFVSLIRFFGFQDKLIEELNKEKSPAMALLQEHDNYSKYLLEASRFIRTIDDREFSSVEEKEAYLDEKTIYNNLLNEFYSIEDWYAPGIFNPVFDKIQALPRPVFDEWSYKYDDVIKVGKPVSEEINNPFMKKMAKLISALGGAKSTVTIQTFDGIRKGTYKAELRKINGLYEEFGPNELPVLKLILGPREYIISTRKFYVNTNGKYDFKFLLDDIEFVNINRGSFTTNFNFGINLVNGNSVRIGTGFPEKEREYLIEFGESLSRFVISNQTLADNTMTRICQNTPDKQLSEEYLDRQLETAARMVYLTSKLHIENRDQLILKWTFAFSKQRKPNDPEYLWDVIKENNIGLEFILMFKASETLVTDKAVYNFTRGEKKAYSVWKFIDPYDSIPEMLKKTRWVNFSDREYYLNIISKASEEELNNIKISLKTKEYKRFLKIAAKRLKEDEPKRLEQEKAKSQYKEEIKKGLDYYKDEFIKNREYLNIDFIYNFRKRFKTCVRGEYESPGYDFIPKARGKIPEPLRDKYQYCGDYILFARMIMKKYPVVLTDKRLYINDVVVKLKDLQDIIYYYPIESSSSGECFRYIELRLINSSIYTVVEDDYKYLNPMLTDLSEALFPFRDPKYIPIEDQATNETVYLCSKCLSRDVRQGILKKFSCHNCGNNDPAKLYEISVAAIRNNHSDLKLNEIDRDLKQYENIKYFNEEENWLVWANKVKEETPVDEEYQKAIAEANKCDNFLIERGIKNFNFHNPRVENYLPLRRMVYEYYDTYKVNQLPEGSFYKPIIQEYYTHISGAMTWYQCIEWVPVECDACEFMNHMRKEREGLVNSILPHVWMHGDPEIDITESARQYIKTIKVLDPQGGYKDYDKGKENILLIHIAENGEVDFVITTKFMAAGGNTVGYDLHDIDRIDCFDDAHIEIAIGENCESMSSPFFKDDNAMNHFIKLLKVICVRYGGNYHVWDKKMSTPKPAVPEGEQQLVNMNEAQQTKNDPTAIFSGLFNTARSVAKKGAENINSGLRDKQTNVQGGHSIKKDPNTRFNGLLNNDRNAVPKGAVNVYNVNSELKDAMNTGQSEQNVSKTEEIECPTCGKSIEADAKFCRYCGAKIPKVKVCSKCGCENAFSSKFCMNCGAPLQEKDEGTMKKTLICPNCGKEIDNDAKFCCFCGAPVKTDDKL